MATRFYFNPSAVNISDIDLSSSLIGNWDQGTSGPTRILSIDEKLVSYGAVSSAAKTGSSAVRVVGAIGQYVTNPLDTLTINFATLKAQFICYEIERDDSAYLSIAVGYCEGDRSNPTLLFHIDDDVEMSDSYLNRQWTAADQTNHVLTQGHRLIVEYGAYFNNSKNETDIAYIYTRNNSGSDLPENDTETSVYDNWFETGDTFTVATVGGGWSAGDVDGVAAAGIAKIMGVAVADITSVTGVA